MTTIKPYLSDTETAEFREKTTNVVRAKWRDLKRKGITPRWSRLVGGPLDGVPNIEDKEPGIFAWCKWTPRGVVVVRYEYSKDTGEWRFSGLVTPGGNVA